MEEQNNQNSSPSAPVSPAPINPVENSNSQPPVIQPPIIDQPPIAQTNTLLPVSPKSHNKLKITAWVITSIGLACFAAFYGVVLWLSGLARNGTSGTEFFIIPFLPLSIIGTVMCLIGSILLLISARFHIRTWTKRLAYILGILLLLYNVYGIASFAYGIVDFRHKTKTSEKTYSKAELVNQIKSCKIDRIDLGPSNQLSLSYLKIDDTTIYLPRAADPTGYAEYVAAAKSVSGKCPSIDFVNFSPTASYEDASAKYINIALATSLLKDCKIKTLNVSSRPIDTYKDSTPAGTKTSVILLDYGTIKHLYATDEAGRNTLTPLGRRAQSTCSGSPQFYTDTGYEQSRPSK